MFSGRRVELRSDCKCWKACLHRDSLEQIDSDCAEVGTLAKEPRRMRLQLGAPSHRQIGLSQVELAEMKCGRGGSQDPTSGCPAPLHHSDRTGARSCCKEWPIEPQLAVGMGRQL